MIYIFYEQFIASGIISLTMLLCVPPLLCLTAFYDIQI